MNRTVRIGALLTAGATAWAAQYALAQQMIPEIYTYNKTDRAVWVTIYDLGKLRHLDYGCMKKGGGTRTWTSGGYAFGSYYYVRGEMKANEDCSGATLCDTTVQINPHNPAIVGGAWVRPKHVDWYIHPNGTNCYWDESSQ